MNPEIKSWNLDWAPPRSSHNIRIEPEGFWGPRYEAVANIKQSPDCLEFSGVSALTRYYPWWKWAVRFFFRRKAK